MKITAENMLVLADGAGKIRALYLPNSASDSDDPKIALVADEHHFVYEVEIPNEIVEAAFKSGSLNSYRIRTEGGRSKLILHDDKEQV
jgi:hypothetical protein